MSERPTIEYEPTPHRPLVPHPAATTGVFIGIFASVWATPATVYLVRGGLAVPPPAVSMLAVGVASSSAIGIALVMSFATRSMRLWGLALNVPPFLASATILFLAVLA